MVDDWKTSEDHLQASASSKGWSTLQWLNVNTFWSASIKKGLFFLERRHLLQRFLQKENMELFLIEKNHPKLSLPQVLLKQ